jgi:hypothetical protein
MIISNDPRNIPKPPISKKISSIVDLNIDASADESDESTM